MAVPEPVKVTSGLRLDKLLYDRFKALCQREHLLVGEAVQRLMQACLDAESIVAVLDTHVKGREAQGKADELRLKGALSRLRVFIAAAERNQWWVTVKDREVRIDQAIYLPAYETAVEVLPRIHDPELIRVAADVMEEANRAVEKAIEQ
jgi:hypothetical protein